MDNDQILQELQNILDQAKVRSRELEEEYNKFSELREELKNKASRTRGFHDRVENDANVLTGLLTESQNLVEQIK